MATETFSMKVEDTPLEAFLAAAADYRQGMEVNGARFGEGRWAPSMIGGVECRTMVWPVESAEVIHLVVAQNDDEELPTLAEAGLTVVTDTGPEAA